MVFVLHVQKNSLCVTKAVRLFQCFIAIHRLIDQQFAVQYKLVFLSEWRWNGHLSVHPLVKEIFFGVVG